MPPVWLVGAMALAWGLDRLAPGLGLGPWAPWAGAVLLAAGVAVMVLAVAQFRRFRTTIVPRKDPSAMIRAGIYRWSRNPIYLADSLILAGLILWWGALLALPLIPGFVWVIQVRFIRGEEERLAAAFPTEFPSYCQATRRWI
ncbi:MAG: isoprenylcysteine carboxylmethyltransferase family protein [Rhodobacteraceae bacterium]|nr:isoprenylcysteine carboxylmethyltransferase family protein [Paracoccaceae bacterium]